MRPNSPPQITSVSSSIPRRFRSATRAALALVGRLAVVPVVARHVRVSVPALVVDVDETHPALDHPPGQQARPRRTTACPGRSRTEPASLDFPSSDPSTPGPRSAAGTPSRTLAIRVAISGSPSRFRRLRLSRADQVQRLALQPRVDPGRAGDVEDRSGPVAQPDARVRPSAESRSTSSPTRR